MTSNGVKEEYALWRDRLTKPYHIGIFERINEHIRVLSHGDRAIAYALAGLVVISSLAGLYALQGTVTVRTPAYGGSLVEGTIGSPRFVHPLLAISDADRDLTALTYAGLMGIGKDGTLEPVIAESYTISPDGRTYTFTLREEAVFSDGTPITAEDVAFTIEKAQDPTLKSPQFANWSGVLVSTPDARTVVFTLARPYAPFLENTTLGILPSHLWQSIPSEQFPFSTLTLEPVGAGPFTSSSISRDASGLITSYALRANSDYPPGRPYISNITFKFFSRDEDLVKALENGSVDSAYGHPVGRTLTAPYARVFGIFFNSNNNEVFTRIEVRKALSVALDRGAIVEDILGGYAMAILGPVPPGSGIIPTPVPTYDDSIAEAADTLERNGWEYDEEERMWGHDNAELSLTTITIKTSNVPELKAIASSVKQNWEALGIPVAIELYEPGDLNQNVIRPRKYEALLFGMVIGRDKDLYAFWYSGERNDPGLNIALYTNKDVDSLLETAREESNPTERLAALQQIEDEVASEYPAAFTHVPHFTYSVPEKLGGVMLPQIATPSDRFATVASWHMRTEAVWPFFVPER